MQRLGEKPVHCANQIGNLGFGYLMTLLNRFHIYVGGADETEFVFERNDKHDTLVVVLQNVGVLLVVHTWHYDMATLYQLHPGTYGYMYCVIEQLLHPRTRRVDDTTRPRFACFARVDITHCDLPHIAYTLSARHPRSRPNLCAMLLRRYSIDHSQAGVIDARVGIKESLPDRTLKTSAVLLIRKCHAARTGQGYFPADMVIHE